MITDTLFLDECIQPTLANGHIVGDGDDRSWTGTFHCDPGYILVGSTRLKCRYGQWSSNFPVCSGNENIKNDLYKTFLRMIKLRS